MSVKKCLEQIGALNELVAENEPRGGNDLWEAMAAAEGGDRELWKAIGAGDSNTPELLKRLFQMRVMDAEEKLCDARETLDKHLALLKKIPHRRDRSRIGGEE